MRTYVGLFRMRMIAGFQYRAAAWAGVATQFFFGAVFILIYKAFYDSSAVQPSMPFDQLVSYLWMQQAFLAIMAVWGSDMSLLDSIATGDIAYELVRPMSLYWLWSFSMAAQRLSSAMMRCLPILLVAGFLPAPYNFNPPPSPLALGLFVLSLILALVVMVAIMMFVYILTFITLSPGGSRVLMMTLTEFLQGAVIPIPLMPNWLQTVLSFLPFRYTSDVPLRIYSGHIQGTEAWICIALQVFWAVTLIALGQWGLKRALDRAVIQGG